MISALTTFTQLVGIIFSKDRPLQLDGTLRSFFMHCQNPDDIVLKVLYATSDAEQEKAYSQLAQNHPSVVFVCEKSFKHDLLSQLQGFDFVLFAVDDTIFVREFHLGDCVRRLREFPDAIGFSLRLGENTTYCYTLDRPQHLPDFKPVNANTTSFEWTASECDFNYPIEVSSSLYRLRDLQSLLESLDYNNPNTLESVLSHYAQMFAASLPRLLTFRRSAAFSAPVNKVQTIYENRAGNRLEYSAAKLMSLYRDGYRLNVAEYSNCTPNACHQEMELKLIRETAPPLVSIIIPCYNQAEFLPESVGSVLAQYFEDWECIIVNDGSPDNTSEVAKQLMNADSLSRIRLIEQENKGLASRNTGVRAARGSFILLLDADDMLHPAYLSETVNVLKANPNYAIVYVDEQNFGNANHVHRKGHVSINALKYANVHDYCSLCHKKVWATVRGYSPAMYLGGEDWNFWLSAAKNGFKSIHLDKPLFLYRNRENTMVSTTLSNLKEVWAHIVFHNPELFSEDEKREALNLLRMSSPENQSKLESVKIKHPLNKLLQFFSQVSSKKETSIPATVLKPTCRIHNPLISVIIPTYNRPDQLVHALKSLLKQTYTTFEAIVVNDCGIDVSKILKALNDHRIVHIRHGKNKGLAATRNTGIRAAKGKYIAYLDDDDIYYSDHLSTLLNNIENYSVIYSNANRLTITDNPLNSHIIDAPYSIDFSKNTLLSKNITPVNCVMHKKDCIDLAGYFDEELSSHEDWDLWIRMSRHFDFKHINIITCEFTWKNDGSTMTSSRELDYIRTRKLIYQKYSKYINSDATIISEQNRILNKIQKKHSASNALATIIIPVFNKINLTMNCIKALMRTADILDFEVIIIDNGSTDGTHNYLAQLNEKFRIITNKTNLGFAQACNQGALLAQGHFLVFLNNDTIPQTGWLTELINIMNRYHDIGVAGSKLLYQDDTIQHCGACMNFDGSFFRHHYKYLHGSHSLVNSERELDAVTAACCITPRKLFFELDMFDINYINGCEDMDYCTKARHAGYRIIYTPSSVLYHLESQTPRFQDKDKDNFSYYLSKWGSSFMKNEIEIYAEDGFWLRNGDRYLPSPNAVTILKDLALSFNPSCQSPAETFQKIVGRIFPCSQWSKNS